MKDCTELDGNAPMCGKWMEACNNLNALLQVWRHISTQMLTPDPPLSLHQGMLAAAYQGWPADQLGPLQVTSSDTQSS
jgi:hypothetical protein